MYIEIKQSDLERLQELANGMIDTQRDNSISLLARVLVQILDAAESEENYKREQSEYNE